MESFVIHRCTDFCITVKLKTIGAYYTEVCVISESLQCLFCMCTGLIRS